VSNAPFQNCEFCYESFDDLEKEEFVVKPLDFVHPSLDEEHCSHEIENIDSLFHVKTLRWD
jgi:hypothetical protein